MLAENFGDPCYEIFTLFIFVGPFIFVYIYSINDIMYNCVDLYWRSRLVIACSRPSSRLSVLNLSAFSAPRPRRAAGGADFWHPAPRAPMRPCQPCFPRYRARLAVRIPPSLIDSCWKRPVLVETMPSCQNKRQSFHAPTPDGMSADSTKLPGPASTVTLATGQWRRVRVHRSH